MPLASLSDDWEGPVVLTDETQTIQWFVADGSKAAIKHIEHQVDVVGQFQFKRDKEGQQHPVMVERDVVPAFWSPAQLVEA